MNCCKRITFWFIQKGYDIYDWVTVKKYQPISNHISSAKLPWLFVGVELVDGEIIDRTTHTKCLVNFNCPITPQSVSESIHPHLIKRCFYLDSKTLKEEEIPAEGITINDP